MKKIQLGKDALILAILTLITVLTWIAFDLYWTLTKTEIPPVLVKQIASLNPKIPVQTLVNLESRISFTQEELSELTLPVIEEEIGEEIATESSEVSTESAILE